MNPLDTYFNAIKERLLNDPLIADFHILRERIMETEGHLRARLTLEGGSMLEFSEYIQQVSPKTNDRCLQRITRQSAPRPRPPDARTAGGWDSPGREVR